MPSRAYPIGRHNLPTRGRNRATWDRAIVHAILDATPVCHVAYVDADGRPITIPTTFARVDDHLVLHSSSGAHLARLARDRGDEVEVCVTVTIVDGWVLARSGMHHSMNYRSVVVRGAARTVADQADACDGLAAILDDVWPDRSQHCRPPNDKELAATTVFHLPLDVVAAKVRAEGAVDDPEDADLPYWAGVVPITSTVGTPIPNDDLRAGITLPRA